MSDLPDRAALEDQVRRLLDRARRRAGASVESVVHQLGPLQPRGATTRRSWYDWHERPETVSALTILGVLHLVGPSGSMELLFGQSTAVEDDAQPGRQLAELERQLTEQRAGTAALEQRLEELARRVESVGQGDSWDALGRLTAEVDDSVRRATEHLGRSWREQSVTLTPGGEAAALRRWFATLQRTMVEVRSSVGEPWRGTYPPPPASDAPDHEVMAWLRDSLVILRRQADEIMSRPAIGAADRAAEPRTKPGGRASAG
jgi:hypothetical protein